MNSNDKQDLLSCIVLSDDGVWSVKEESHIGSSTNTNDKQVLFASKRHAPLRVKLLNGHINESELKVTAVNTDHYEIALTDEGSWPLVSDGSLSYLLRYETIWQNSDQFHIEQVYNE